MHTVSSAVREFMNSDEVRSLAANTRKRQATALRFLLTAADGPAGTDPIARLSRAHIDAALSVPRDRRVGESTINAYKVDLRRFSGWLQSNALTKHDAGQHLKGVRVATPKRKRKPISGSQARDVIEVAEAMHPRDGMTALLMLSTGLRESEVVRLMWGDLDLPNYSATAYRPKQRDYHPVHFTPQCHRALEKWQAFYSERHGAIRPNWYVVPALAHSTRDLPNNRMSADWPMVPGRPQTNLGTRVKLWLAAVGETDLRGRASHTMRRTAANLLYVKTGDIRVVQTFLGHASVAMTELYLDIDAAQEKLRSSIEGFEI